MKIYWLKQKAIGLALIVGPLFVWDLLIETEAVVCVPFYWLFGILFLIEKHRMFRSDYILDLKILKRVIKRKIARKLMRIRDRRL